MALFQGNEVVLNVFNTEVRGVLVGIEVEVYSKFSMSEFMEMFW